jgi:hypothetical protein
MSTTEIEHMLQHINPSLTTSQTKSIQQQLEQSINDLIQNNFDRLIQLLYRIDVNEKKLKQLLNGHPQTDAATIISQLIIERQLQKLQTRKQFKNNEDIADEDKW